MTISNNKELTPAAVAWMQQFDASLLNGKTVINRSIYGRRTGNFNDNTTQHDIAEFLGTAQAFYYPPDAGVAMEVVSTSANDASAGTGVQTITVVYLDPTGAQQSTTVTMNGVTPVSVASGALIRRVQWIHALTVGSGGTAAGNITIRKTSTVEILDQITAGGNMSLTSRYTVPLGYSAYLLSWQASAGANAQDLRIRATVNKLTRGLLPGVFLFQDENLLSVGAEFDNDLAYMQLPPLCDVKVSTITATTNGNKVSACFDMIVVQN